MTITKDTIMELDETNDFGFTFHDEEDIVTSSGVTDEVEVLKNRLRTLRKTYLPLLQHLAKDPDKPMIKWPNRGPILEKQIDNLLKITRP